MSLRFTVLQIAILLLFTAKAVAEENKFSYLQSSHEAISQELINLADRIDKIFGEPRASDKANRTTVRLGGAYDWTGRGDNHASNEVRVNLRLPILERKGRVVTDKLSFDSNEKNKSEPAPLITQDQTPVTQVDEVSTLENINSRWHFRAEPGVRLGPGAAFFEKARATKTFYTGNLAHNFSQEVTWDTARLWAEGTVIASDYALSDRWLLRFENRGDWEISDSRFYSYHGPDLIQKLTEYSAISYGAKLQSQVLNARWYADVYRISVNYRTAIYSNWAFLELTPALLFEKEQNFKGMTNLTARLEFLFGAI